MKCTSIFSAILAATVLFTACKKDKDTANPSGQPQLSYQIKLSENTSGVAQKGTAANITWTAGYAYPRRIKLEAKKDNLKVEFSSTSDDRIDLFASTAASFGGFTIPAGTYDEIEVKLNLDKKASDPAMELQGSFTNGSTTIPIILDIDDNVELKTETENVTITDNASFVAVTTLDMSQVTDGISQTMILNAQLTNGNVVISSHSNTILYHILLSNLGSHRYHCFFEHHGH